MTPLVAVEERMVPGEAHDEDGGLLDEGRIEVLVAKASGRLRSGRRRRIGGQRPHPEDPTAGFAFM